MEFAGGVKIDNAMFLCITSSFGQPLYHAYPLMSKLSQTKLHGWLVIHKPPTNIKPCKIKTHLVHNYAVCFLSSACVCARACVCVCMCVCVCVHVCRVYQ